MNNYPGVTYDRATDDIRQLVRRIATTVNNLLRGKVNVAVEFTPAVAATTTVVNDSRLTPNSVLLIEATSSAGATELASGSMFIDSTNRGARTCTVTHTAAAANQLFRLVILA